ncbi:hypothetical protein [Thioalkalivibrio sp. ALMg11]|uniref:hypothetical protein n=1 Tax=Thioalkalivibrio sp. ALMg11 TaxID=1158165 RepID=UPI000363B3AD|nr:hypothetical protein [Thioalkalivibrio sp. ALMg11]
MKPPRLYRIVDRKALTRALDLPCVQSLADTHHAWVADALRNNSVAKDDRWSQALAGRSDSFVRQIQAQLGIRTVDRSVRTDAEATHLAEDPAPCTPIPGRKWPLQGQ